MERSGRDVVPCHGAARIEIFEAMAMEKAIVSTTVGAEGLPVHHRSGLLLADTPEDFAAAVVRVLADQEFADRLGVARHGLCASSLVGIE